MGEATLELHSYIREVYEGSAGRVRGAGGNGPTTKVGPKKFFDLILEQ